MFRISIFLKIQHSSSEQDIKLWKDNLFIKKHGTTMKVFEENSSLKIRRRYDINNRADTLGLLQNTL